MKGSKLKNRALKRPAFEKETKGINATNGKVNKEIKKAKLLNGHVGDESGRTDKEDEFLNHSNQKVNTKKERKINGSPIEDSNGEERSTKPGITLRPVDTSLFKYFEDITSEEENTRSTAVVKLLQHLNKSKDEEKRKRELNYALKRLIRGCGSSSNLSRSGFFTGLVALLKAFSVEEITVEQVLVFVEKELHVGATIANKEDADAVVGKILVCNALLHAGRLNNVNLQDLQKVVHILLKASKHRTYHASLGFSTIVDLINALEQEQFESGAWPQIQQEIVKPWPRQTLHTLYCLMSIQMKFPSIVDRKFLEIHFSSEELLNPKSFKQCQQIFWDRSNMNVLTHPALEKFGVYVAQHSLRHLVQFWSECVEPSLARPTKLLEIETLKIVTDIINHLPAQRSYLLVQFLSDNFVKMLMEGLKSTKQKKDETLDAFYQEFLEALVARSGKITEDKYKVQVILRLILPPMGNFNLEKFTNTNIIHQLVNLLGEEGVKQVFGLYKSIFLGTLEKKAGKAEESSVWTNAERFKAGYMLQHLLSHRAVHGAYKWREEQLRFLFTCGIFYVRDGTTEVCKKSEAGDFSKEYGLKCKNMFYTNLQSKLTDLASEKQLLMDIVSYCHSQMQQKHFDKHLKAEFDEKLKDAWQKMFVAVNEAQKHLNRSEAKQKKKSAQKAGASKENDNDEEQKLILVFQILLLNMGLHLFREPEMAVPAIHDLLNCLQRIKDPHAAKGKNSENEEEPEWIEVLVDLCLHLLSQNSFALRNIVNALFPHLCKSLNLNAIHQILYMLDMKDGFNPLSRKGDDQEEDEDENISQAEMEDEDLEEDENGDDEDDDNGDDEDEDDDNGDDEDDEDEEITETDKLRNAISQALMENGAAHGGADDDVSVDLNDLTEEEGRKLDEALASAFRAMRKGPSSEKAAKKTKTYRVTLTTVMHFRIRVLDLLEIYLQHKPSLLVGIEVMLSLFDMLQYCVGDEMKTLQARVEKVLTKLTARQTVYNVENDVSQQDIANFIRAIMEKPAPVSVFQLMNRLRSKCVAFLITSSGKEGPASQVMSDLLEYVQEFFTSRNPLLNITIITDLFKMCWPGVWALASALATEGLKIETRTFRRIQTCEALTALYNNYALQKADFPKTTKEMAAIDHLIGNYIKALITTTNGEDVKQSPKEYQVLQTLLASVRNAHKRLSTNSLLLSEEITSQMKDLIKKQGSGGNKQNCKKKFRAGARSFMNGEDVTNGDASQSDSDEGEATKQVRSSKKRKAPQTKQELGKYKKQKKLRRLAASSSGLEEGFTFAKDGNSDEE